MISRPPTFRYDLNGQNYMPGQISSWLDGLEDTIQGHEESLGISVMDE